MMTKKNTFTLKNKTILITGGAGLVGSHIADSLLKKEIQKIYILDDLSRGKASHLKSALKTGRTELIKDTITNKALVKNLVSKSDMVIHLAALRINHCVKDPRLAFDVMANGTFSLLEACANYQIKKILFASSASIYGMAETFPSSEKHHPYNNRTLYGALKLFNEQLFSAFNEMSQLNSIGVRFFNIYGPRMDATGKYTEVLIKWYKALKEGLPPTIFGDGSQTIDLIYSKDVAALCVQLLEQPVSNTIVNIGTGQEVSLNTLCKTLIHVMKKTIIPIHKPLPDQRQKVEVIRRQADISLLKSLVTPPIFTPLLTGLTELVDDLDKTLAPHNEHVLSSSL